MNIAVIGTGAAALGVVTYLRKVSKKFMSVDVIAPQILPHDFKSQINNKEASEFLKSLEKTFVPKKMNLPYKLVDQSLQYPPRHDNLLLWGCSALPYPSDEYGVISRFSKREFDNAFDHLAKYINVSGDAREALSNVVGSKHINQPPIQPHQTLSKLNERLNFDGTNYRFISGTAHIALSYKATNSDAACDCFVNNCDQHSLFLLKQFNDAIFVDNQFTKHLDAVVQSFDLETSKLTLLCSKTKKISEKQYDKIFVCAGAIGTADLLIRSSIARKVSFHDTTSYVVPFLSFSFRGLRRSTNYFSLTNVVTILENKDKGMLKRNFIQFYPISRYFLRPWFNKAFWPLVDLVVRVLSRFCFVAVIYLDDDQCSVKSVKVAGEEIKIDTDKKSPDTARRAAKDTIVALIKRLGIIRFLPLALKELQTSHHFGNLEADGKPFSKMVNEFRLLNFYFCGSSCFESMTASSPTLSIAAHGFLTAKKAFEDK